MRAKTLAYLAIAKAALWLEAHGVNPWGKGWLPSQKAAIWKAADRIARAHEAAFASAARAAFESDRRAILAALRDAEIKALSRKSTVDWDSFALDVGHYLETQGGENWRSKFVPVIRALVTSQGKRWQATTGIRFDVQSLEARDWFNRYALVFAQQVNTTTRDDIARIIAAGQRDGLSIGQMQKQINALFDVWQDNAAPDDPDWQWIEDRRPTYRTEMIARTETIRSSNAGSTEIFREWGVQKKEWLSTQDDRTRGAPGGRYENSEFDHWDANGETVSIDDVFIATGEPLQFPGDPSGSPGNTINCRCTVLPVIE